MKKEKRILQRIKQCEQKYDFIKKALPVSNDQE